MSKTELARRTVATAVLAVPIGGRLPATKALAEQSGTGHGTIQAALVQLESSGAVRTTAHGGFGRTLRERDLVALWEASQRGALEGILPLPDSREFGGLATGLSVVAERQKLPLRLLFRQGSSVRLRFLDERSADFVVLSKAALESAGTEYEGRLFGPNSYYAQGSVVILTAAGKEPVWTGRVPIDRTSADHVALTQRAFPRATFVDTPYPFIPELVVAGKVDAAIWHRSTASPLLNATGLAVHPAPTEVRELAVADQERAALAWRKEDAGVGEVLTHLVDLDEVEHLQREVVNGTRIPQF